MRPIDADAEFLVTANYGCGITGCYRMTVAEYLGENMNKIPTIDAVPVVHGYWRPHPLGYTSNLVKYEEWDVCSNCGIGTKRRNMTDDFFEEYSYSYCPWCGAKMDAKEGTEE